MYLSGGSFVGRGRFKYRKMGWPLHWKKNFFINDSVGFSMCDCPIETVKYCTFGWIFDACLIKYCHKTGEIHFLWIQQLKLGVQKLGTLMQIWKSAKSFVFLWKYYVEDFTLKQLLLLKTCTCEICEKFVYKHSETIGYVKN